MEIEYSKDLYHNYMIIREPEDRKVEHYYMKMLHAEGLQKILKPDSRSIDNQKHYYYDITAKQSLVSLFEKAALSEKQVKKLLGDVLETIAQAYGYLLEERDFILTPETIYLDLNTGDYYICYLPGYYRDIKLQLNGLIEYIMNKIDHKDKEAVLLIYSLYATGREEGASFEQLRKHLTDSQPQALEYSKEARGSSRFATIGRSNTSETGQERQQEFSAKKEHKAYQEHIEHAEKREPSQYDFPIMKEKITKEQELSCYSIKTYLYTIGCSIIILLFLLICFKYKLLHNALKTHVDYMKLFAVLLISFCSGGYILTKLWDKKNKVTKIISKEEYIDPREERKITEETAAVVSEDSIQPTCLLSSWNPTSYCMLNPLEEKGYEPIKIIKFPFFIGKQRNNVDYCLEKDVISRFHAKITKEEDRYYLTDLNSTNGTYLNKEPLMTYQCKELHDGDETVFADISYRFEIKDA